MTAPRVLVVDDRDGYVQLCHRYLRGYVYLTRCDLPGPCWDCHLREGCVLTHAHGWAELDEAMTRNGAEVDVVLLDVDFQLPEAQLLPLDKPPLAREDLARLRRYQGIEILRQLRRTHGDIPVVLMTAYEDLAFEEDADALAAEEYTYFAGEDAMDARALGLLIERVAARRRAAPEAGGFFWGSAEVMTRLRQRAEILARGDRPILVLGETGTGKSLLAERVVHPASGRRGRFSSVDLAAIPESLVAAELFGTTRGAFSGAADRPGRFEHGDGGTLLLDEVGNLRSEVQRALLTVLQDRRVTRLGSNDPVSIDVKLVAATNEDLEALVRDGRFRPDLLMRLNPAARLVMPPLRSRQEDIPALVSLFVRRCFGTSGNRAMLEEYSARLGLPALRPAQVSVAFGVAARPRAGLCFAFPGKTAREMTRAPWPGNVRQLELVVESAVVTALGDALRAPGEAARGAPQVVPVGAKLLRDLIQAGDAMGAAPGLGAAAEAPGPADVLVRLEPAEGLRDVSRAAERSYMGELYRRTGGDFVRMAGLLLDDASPRGARRVRLRFNQLGLRVRVFE